MSQGGVFRKFGLVFGSVGGLMHAGGGLLEGTTHKDYKKGPEEAKAQEGNFARLGVMQLELQGSDPSESGTRPGAEVCHDQKKGIRIGESRIPAQGEQDK